MDRPRRTGHRLLALGAAGLLVLGLAACSSSDDDESSSGDTTTTAAAAGSGTDYSGSTDTTSADAPSDAPAEGTAPVIQNFAFDPDPISIAVGDTVTWTNEDGTTHTVTADDDSFDSGNLSSGDTFSQTFDEAGEFTYHCNIHSSMTGTVTVNS